MRTFLFRLRLAAIRLVWRDAELLIAEALVARAARAPGPGDVVLSEARVAELDSKLRAHHRRLYPRSMGARMTLDEIAHDLGIASVLDAAGD